METMLTEVSNNVNNINERILKLENNDNDIEVESQKPFYQKKVSFNNFKYIINFNYFVNLRNLLT